MALTSSYFSQIELGILKGVHVKPGYLSDIPVIQHCFRYGRLRTLIQSNIKE
jgi:hypothetical protein